MQHVFMRNSPADRNEDLDRLPLLTAKRQEYNSSPRRSACLLIPSSAHAVIREQESHHRLKFGVNVVNAIARKLMIVINEVSKVCFKNGLPFLSSRNVTPI